MNINISVAISSSNDQKGYTLSYLYEDTFNKRIYKRALLINPNLNNYLYKDNSLSGPLIVDLDKHVMKSFKLENLEIGENTKLSIYITLPLLSSSGNSYVATIHEIEIKKK